jgi:choline dehydrogenase
VYDYVIVGAGTAGCVLASRLSEDSAVRVLLLEAGPADRKAHIHVPAAFSKLFKTAVDWQYHTEEQVHLNNRRLYWPRGRVLGGSSSINAMIYIRGHPSDYDGWKALGNAGWGYADVLPYFKKAEDQERLHTEYHGRGGPLHVADLRCVNPLTRVFLSACGDRGITSNDDFNGACQQGAGLYQVTQRGGQRHSTAAAYLRPARRRRNLTIRTQALATRILLEGRRAIGVEYLLGGKTEQARAEVEVILSGGSINSPHLLLLSGIGPADHLRSLGIAVSVNLPGVGQNLQDHLLTGVSYACTQPISLDRAENLANILRYLFLRRGPLTSNIGEAGAFVESTTQTGVPGLQLYFAPAYFIQHGFLRPPGYGFSIGACPLRPFSRGEIRLRSTDPREPPAIQPRYLEDPRDLDLLVEGLQLARWIAASAAFDPHRGPEYLPGEKVQTDGELREHIRRWAETLYHPVGTCKMGADPLAVVNDRLQVHQLQALRVVDASVMPTLPGGNTNAPTIMIAEKAADLIRRNAG